MNDTDKEALDELTFYRSALQKLYGPLNGWDWNKLARHCAVANPRVLGADATELLERLVKHHGADLEALGITEDMFSDIVRTDAKIEMLQAGPTNVVPIGTKT